MPFKHLLYSAALAALLPGAVLSQSMGSADQPGEIDPLDAEDQERALLDLTDPTGEAWAIIREDLSAGREPGPINIQRFPGGMPWVGIPTFFNLPVALTPEDLAAGQVEVAIMGAEFYNSPRVQSYGPTELRANTKSSIYHAWGDWEMPHLDSGLKVFQELTVVDYGDAPLHPYSTALSIEPVRAMVRDIASVELDNGKRTIPIIVGGGHGLMYPDSAGLTDVYGKGNLTVIHFDAHADQSPAGFGVGLTHGNPVRKLVEGGFVNGEDVIQIGLRGPSSTDLNGVAWNRSSGLRYHMMTEVEARGWQSVMDDVLAEARATGKPVFLSFDIDVVDPAFIPGTSTPEAGGLYMREVLPLVRRICAENNLVGMELVELRPERDPGYISVQNSYAILRQCINGIAMAKKGLPDNYLHPELVDDGK